jgi:hypothetical protein
MNKLQPTSKGHKQSTSDELRPGLLPDSNFRKSSFSASGNCVEVGRERDGTVMVRDTKNASQQALRFSRSEWIAFLSGVKCNEFDVQ